MVPYIHIPPLTIGPLSLYPFGALVGLAIIVGSSGFVRRAGRVGLDERVASDIVLWAVIPGFIGAHLYSVIFYFPERILEDPLVLLKLWDGISSFGGFMGGALGVVYYLRKHRIPVLPYADSLAYGFIFAWVFGRLGCSVAHDHPGLPTDFVLGVDRTNCIGFCADYVPTLEGGAHVYHDLGLYEFIWSLGLALVFYLGRNRTRWAGWHLAVFIIAYTPVRFMFDFLRTADERYLGLTAGQYAAFLLLGIVLAIWVKQSRAGHVLVPGGPTHVFPDGRLAIEAPKPVVGGSRGAGGASKKGKRKKR